MERSALYAGSFDPLTNGHLDIIRRASNIFDSITVAVIANPGKKSMLTLEERIDIIEHSCSDIPNVTIDSFDGLLADYVNRHAFNCVIRGLRATTDFEYEIQMAQMNARLYTEGTETIFLMTDPRYSFISSSMIKEVVSLGGSVDGLIPAYSKLKISEKFGN